ncbi:MAG: peptidoglycan-binding protein [Albidovulum sp.]
MRCKHLIPIAAFMFGGPTFAQDAALLIANETYAHAAHIATADALLDSADALDGAGFTSRKGVDLRPAQMHSLLSGYYSNTVAPGRSVIALAGHFVHSGAETWLLGVDAASPTLANADIVGLSLSTVLAMAAERPGGAIVLLGTERRQIALGRGLTAGIGRINIPQGVTLVWGDAEDVADFASNVVVERGLSLADMARRAGDLNVAGFLATGAPFREVELPDEPEVAEDAAAPAADVEADLWETTQAINTQLGYQSYLRRYPSGRFSEEARKAIATLSDPVAQARIAEEAMRLTRDQRRQIQRDLSILDIDPKGIDGVFGPGSRNAISSWQRQAGFERTGYLTTPQMAALGAEAERRAAELEAEAAARKVEQDRQDQLYWDQTGTAGDEAGLRAYLKRYPDGLFAELAQERLAVFDAARRSEAEAADRAAWDEAVRLNTVDGFQAYLGAQPNGAFADEARQLIAGHSSSAEEDAAQAKAERVENALGLNGTMRNLIEQRLTGLGLKPGRIDGTFDDDTRRAIRRYQQARGLPVSGYLSQQTVARLLIDSL